jgi:hypothetical protein
MSKVEEDLRNVKRELGIDPERKATDQVARLARYLQRIVSVTRKSPDSAGRYDLTAFGLSKPGTLEGLAEAALSGSATAQRTTLRKLLQKAKPVLAAEEKRIALRPRDEPGVVRARISGVVGLAPNRRDLIVTPLPRAKAPAWWDPSDPWPVAQFHAIAPGMDAVARVGATVKAGDVLARAGTTAVCMGIPKPTRKGSIGEARTVVLPEPMARGYMKIADYPSAASEEEAVVRYILDEWPKASNYVQEVGEDVALERLESGDVRGLFTDLKLGGFKVKSKRKMTAYEAVAHADRIVNFLAGKGSGPGEPAYDKWSGLSAKWSSMPSDTVVEVQTNRKLPDVEVDAWRWDGVDWACARGGAIRYRERAERSGEGPIGLVGAVESALRDGGDIEVQYKSSTGASVQLRVKPERLVTRPGGTLLLGLDRASDQRVTLRVANIERVWRPRVERARVTYPWAIQAEQDDAERLLSESTSTIQVGSEPPPDFGGRVYIFDKDRKGFVGSVAFVAADPTPKGRWVWLFRDPQPYGFLFKNDGFKPVKGSWPAGQWFIDPEEAADPPNVQAARELAQEQAAGAFAAQLFASPLRKPESLQEELDVLIRAASDDNTPLRSLRSMFAALKSRLPQMKSNPRKRFRRLTR